MQEFDIGSSLKVQQYLNSQTLSDDTLSFLENLKFRKLVSIEEKRDIYKKVERYRVLEQDQFHSPSAEASAEMQELAQDVMYSTGQPINSLNISSLKTTEDIDDAMIQSNLRSKNDLFVDIDYDDYSNNSNYVKCKIVSHDHPYAYGISAGARMAITKNGTIITTKNALYNK